MGSPIDEEAVEALIAEKTELEMKMGDPQVQKDQQQARKSVAVTPSWRR